MHQQHYWGFKSLKVLYGRGLQKMKRERERAICEAKKNAFIVFCGLFSGDKLAGHHMVPGGRLWMQLKPATEPFCDKENSITLGWEKRLSLPSDLLVYFLSLWLTCLGAGVACWCHTGVILILSMGNCPPTFFFDDGNAAFLCPILGEITNDICIFFQK